MGKSPPKPAQDSILMMRVNTRNVNVVGDGIANIGVCYHSYVNVKLYDNYRMNRIRLRLVFHPEPR